MKDLALLTRYPYAAGVIGVMWLGVAIVASARPDIHLEALLFALCVATIIIVIVGFRRTQ